MSILPDSAVLNSSLSAETGEKNKATLTPVLGAIWLGLLLVSKERGSIPLSPSRCAKVVQKYSTVEEGNEAVYLNAIQNNPGPELLSLEARVDRLPRHVDLVVSVKIEDDGWLQIWPFKDDEHRQKILTWLNEQHVDSQDDTSSEGLVPIKKGNFLVLPEATDPIELTETEFTEYSGTLVAAREQGSGIFTGAQLSQVSQELFRDRKSHRDLRRRLRLKGLLLEISEVKPTSSELVFKPFRQKGTEVVIVPPECQTDNGSVGVRVEVLVINRFKCYEGLVAFARREANRGYTPLEITAAISAANPSVRQLHSMRFYLQHKHGLLEDVPGTINPIMRTVILKPYRLKGADEVITPPPFQPKSDEPEEQTRVIRTKADLEADLEVQEAELERGRLVKRELIVAQSSLSDYQQEIRSLEEQLAAKRTKLEAEQEEISQLEGLVVSDADLVLLHTSVEKLKVVVADYDDIMSVLTQ